MARRPDDTVTLTCPLSDVEQDFAAELMRAGGFTSQGNLVRAGLWHLAKHLDVPVTRGTFGQRSTRGNAGTWGARGTRLTARELTADGEEPDLMAIAPGGVSWQVVDDADDPDAGEA